MQLIEKAHLIHKVLRAWITTKIKNCVKNVQIRSYFWFVFSCIRTEYGDLLVRIQKIRTRNNSVFGHFSRSEISLLSPNHVKLIKIKLENWTRYMLSLLLALNIFNISISINLYYLFIILMSLCWVYE